MQRIRELERHSAPIEIRGRNKVSAIGQHDDHMTLDIDTPEGPYNLETDWLIACDGAGSPTRQMLGIDFAGRAFEDNFLIADVVMEAKFPHGRSCRKNHFSLICHGTRSGADFGCERICPGCP